jgi:broad specificity phosphatase PhoE
VDEIQLEVTRRSRVILVRHGHTANSRTRGWIRGDDVQAWRDATDAVGIADHSVPPQDTIDRVAPSNHVMASDLARAIESARRLLPGRDIEISPLFHEENPEVPHWLPMRWPLRFWQTVGGVQWLYQIARGTDAPPPLLSRVAAAADLLRERARMHELTTVVCHRYIRRLLGRQLERDGWTRAPGRHSYANWSAWEYSIDPDARKPWRA